ncbi:hypothetical protein HRbin22_01993 [Candidatus Thermoflexus japonica]|uniref:DUF5666 domain-containing protein n=1 Tax=Candidatus Thermoflexus japonica TaxID=2035417 RepID=A0A2H5Y8J6_9CHLR|nr:hypothetical protein HRbin22_01993 [Candidatus Thermoflexus japonica]
MRLQRILLGFLLVEAAILGSVPGCVRKISEGGPQEPPRAAPGLPSPTVGGPRDALKPPSPAPGEAHPVPGEAVLTLEGPIEAVIPGGYRVAGHPVRVSPEIDSEGPLPPGIYVTVIGTRAPDGAVIAEALEVLRRPESEGEWEGTIQEVLPHGYRVDEHRVLVLPTTAVMGNPEPGQYVYLSGFEQPDGSIIADSIIVLESP